MLTRRHLKYSLLLYSAPILGIIAIEILGRTYRYKIKNFAQNVIFGIWHGEMFPLIFPFRKEKIYVIITKGFDGDILARVLRFFGYNIIRISYPIKMSEIGKIKTKIQSGYGMVFALDGPKGPAFQPKRGAFYFSGILKRPLKIVKVVAEKRWNFPVWDGFMIPHPFANVEIKMEEAADSREPLAVGKRLVNE